MHSVHDSSDEAPPATAKPHAVPPPSEPIDLAASEEDDALGEMDDVELAPSAGPSAAGGGAADHGAHLGHELSHPYRSHL